MNRLPWIAAAVLLAAGLLLGGGYAIKYAINKAADATVVAEAAISANTTTNQTLERTTNATARMVEVTENLSDDLNALSRDTAKGLRGLQRSLNDAKQIDLDARVPRDVIVPLCMQWARASGYGGPVAGEALPGAHLQDAASALAEQCSRAWGRVTWRDLVEYMMPLMQYGGDVKLQLEAGAKFYAPRDGNHMGKESQ